MDTRTQTFDYLIIVECQTTCDDQTQIQIQQEVVELGFVAFNLSNYNVDIKGVIYITPQWNANPNIMHLHFEDDPSAIVSYARNFREAINILDGYLYSNFIALNRTICLMTSGHYKIINHPLVSEALRKCVKLGPHYTTYFTLEEEFLKVFPDICAPVHKGFMISFLGVVCSVSLRSPTLFETILTTEIVHKLILRGHLFFSPRLFTQVDMNYMMLQTPCFVERVACGVPIGDVVRIRGLPWTCTVDDIRNFFQGVAIVPQGIHVLKNPNGKLTGEGFIQTMTKEAAGLALRKHRQLLGHRYIEVFQSSPQEMAGYFNKPSLKSFSTAQGRRNTKILQTSPATDTPSVLDPSSYILRMRGLPFSATADDIIQFLEGVELLGKGIHVMSGKDGRPTGEAFIEVAHENAIKKALKLDRHKIGNRYIEVFKSSHSEFYTTLEKNNII